MILLDKEIWKYGRLYIELDFENWDDPRCISTYYDGFHYCILFGPLGIDFHTGYRFGRVFI